MLDGGAAAPSLPAAAQGAAQAHARGTARSKQQADLTFFNQGITFTVYGRNEATERIFPHDLLPRIITAADWDVIERGLTQRITALNLFLKDIYHEQRILKDGRRARQRDLHLPAFPPADDRRHGAARRLCQRHGHRSGAAARRPVRGARRQPARPERRVVHALEPQGHEADLPGAVPDCGVRPIEQYGQALLSTLRSLAPDGRTDPTVVLLTPGVYNSAYYEHAFLARQMGIELVEGRDLVVHDNVVYMRTTHGLKRVDVIYRRVDDDFLDPLAFRVDSSLGVAGAVQRLSRRQRHARQRARHRRRRRQGDLRLRAAASSSTTSAKIRSSTTSRPADDRRHAARHVLDRSRSSSSRRSANRAATAC